MRVVRVCRCHVCVDVEVKSYFWSDDTKVHVAYGDNTATGEKRFRNLPLRGHLCPNCGYIIGLMIDK